MGKFRVPGSRLSVAGFEILYKKVIKLKLSGNEVYFTNSLILLGKNMLGSKLHCQKGFNLIPFLYKIAPIPGERETPGYEPLGREIRKQRRVVESGTSAERHGLIPASIHHEYDSSRGIGAVGLVSKGMAPIPNGQSYS